MIKIADVFCLLDPATFFFLLCALSCYLSAVLFFAYVFKHRQTKSAVTSAGFVYFHICKRKAFFRASNFEINKPLFFMLPSSLLD